ncbi:hypothetical protein RXV90_25505 [Rhodophyticola sp. MJ-SS7]|nr:hypothetical protein [Rhodophyticola sp. MJ-SS7]
MFTSKSASALCIAFVSLAAGCSSLPHSDAATRSGVAVLAPGLDQTAKELSSFKTCIRWLADGSDVSSKNAGFAFRSEARDETCGGDDLKLSSLNPSLQRDRVAEPTSQSPESVAAGDPAPQAPESLPDPEDPEVPVVSTEPQGPSPQSQTENGPKNGPKSTEKLDAPGQAKDRSAKTSLKERFDAGRGNGSEGGDPGNSQEHNQGDG